MCCASESIRTVIEGLVSLLFLLRISWARFCEVYRFFRRLCRRFVRGLCFLLCAWRLRGIVRFVARRTGLRGSKRVFGQQHKHFFETVQMGGWIELDRLKWETSF